METNFKSLMLKQLDKKLADYKALNISRPAKGWIYAIRKALGMSGRQLAKRAGVTQPRINEIEKGETDHSITMKTLIQIADALDCDLVYTLVPRTSLKEMVKKQAEKVINNQMKNTSHTMNLENQSFSQEDFSEINDNNIKSVTTKIPSWLWDDVE
jgi:predicted DNA-binding mobile mystery protein A